MTCSGLTIWMFASAWMSAAVTAPAFEALIASEMVSRLCETIRTFFRLRTISVTSSTTPSMLWNSWFTPSILMDEIAAPSIELRSTRRSELPTVWP